MSWLSAAATTCTRAGQALHHQLGLELGHFGLRGVAVGEDRLQLGLRHHAALRQRRLPRRLPLRLAQPHPRRLQRRLGDGDLLGPAPLAQVGELGLGPVAGGLGFRQRDLGVGALLPRDDVADAYAVALARRHLDQRGGAHRREVDVLALDIAHGENVRGGACRQPGDQRQGAEKAAHETLRSASSRALRLRTIVSVIAAASASPIGGQAMRRCTTGRAMWK